MNTQIDAIEIAPKAAADASVIWLHGLGATADDFEPFIKQLDLPPEHGVRFILPQAPLRSVTINAGMEMPAWYDIAHGDVAAQEDAAGIRDTEQFINALIARERELGIASDRIVLAGFSQGGAMALHAGLRYDAPLAGIIALSTYLPLADTIEDEVSAHNQSIQVFMGHGNADEIVPLHYAKASHARLARLGCSVAWHEYEMAHSASLEEAYDISVWLKENLSL